MWLIIWNWIITNLTTIKDILWIIFTFVATLVAFLTYRRARFTLLQPLRTEVIKRQTDLLVQLLDYLNGDGANLLFKLDYMGITTCNCYQHMKAFGFIVSDHAELDAITASQAGMLILKDSGQLSFAELPGMIKTKVQDKDDEEAAKTALLEKTKQMYQNAKNGIIDIECLFLTEQYRKCHSTLSSFVDNPFMPSSIQQLLGKLQDEINYNLKIVMKSAIEEFILQLCSEKIDESNPVAVSSSAVYNSFNRNRKSHKATINKILMLTREYLMIDKKWH